MTDYVVFERRMQACATEILWAAQQQIRTTKPNLKPHCSFEKVRYRGVAKNHNRLCACFALGNLYLHRKRLAPSGA